MRESRSLGGENRAQKGEEHKSTFLSGHQAESKLTDPFPSSLSSSPMIMVGLSRSYKGSLPKSNLSRAP